MNTLLQPQFLPRAKRWALILAICTIVLTFFNVIQIITLLVRVSRYGDAGDVGGVIGGLISTVVYVLTIIFLLKLQNSCGRFMTSRHPQDLIAAAQNQKRYIMLIGIYLMVLTILFALGFIIGIIAAAVR